MSCLIGVRGLQKICLLRSSLIQRAPGLLALQGSGAWEAFKLLKALLGEIILRGNSSPFATFRQPVELPSKDDLLVREATGPRSELLLTSNSFPRQGDLCLFPIPQEQKVRNEHPNFIAKYVFGITVMACSMCTLVACSLRINFWAAVAICGTSRNELIRIDDYRQTVF